MENALKELIRISQFYGKNKDFTIASGGNTSVKDEKTMYVKASGYELAKIGKEGYVAMDRQMLDKLKTRSYSENNEEREAQVKSDLLKSRIFPELNQRPSVEASVHHAMKYKFIIHMHPTVVNAVTCAKNAEKTINELYGDEAVFIPYITPGYILYKEIENQNDIYFKSHGKYPQVFFLQNHGVFVGAETTEEINEKYDWIINAIKSKISNELEDKILPVDGKFSEIIPAIRAALSANKLKVGKIRNSSLINEFLKSDEKLEHLANPFTPDGIVFCGPRPLIVEEGANPSETLGDFKIKLAEFRAASGYDPKIIMIRGLGVFALGDNINASEIAIDVFEDILKIAHYALNFGGQNFMNKDDDQYQKNIKQSLIDIAVESWRFSRLFSRLLDKLDAGESSRYVNQHRFYLKRLDENLIQAGIRLVNVEGQVYDTGMAATALNAEDFDPDDNLVVDQMLDPIIMGEEGLVRTGTVILRRVEL